MKLSYNKALPNDEKDYYIRNRTWFHLICIKIMHRFSECLESHFENKYGL